MGQAEIVLAAGAGAVLMQDIPLDVTYIGMLYLLIYFNRGVFYQLLEKLPCLVVAIACIPAIRLGRGN
jgi:hypothetical protein